MDPQQEFFTALRMRLKTRYPGKIYDTTLPPRGTQYPFIYLADTRQTDRETKTVIIGTVGQSVRIWHCNPHERGTLSMLMHGVKTAARQIERTANYAWDVKITTQEILDDTTVTPPLLMGVLEISAGFTPLV